MKIGNPQEQVRLRELAGKIRALLKEYDVAGIVNIQGKDQAEFVNEITPSWSCLSWERDTADRLGMRFRCKLKTGDAAEKERGRLTAGMVMGFHMIAAQQYLQFEQVREMISEHMEIDHVSEQQITPPPGLQPPPK